MQDVLKARNFKMWCSHIVPDRFEGGQNWEIEWHPGWFWLPVTFFDKSWTPDRKCSLPSISVPHLRLTAWWCNSWRGGFPRHSRAWEAVGRARLDAELLRLSSLLLLTTPSFPGNKTAHYTHILRLNKQQVQNIFFLNCVFTEPTPFFLSLCLEQCNITSIYISFTSY